MKGLFKKRTLDVIEKPNSLCECGEEGYDCELFHPFKASDRMTLCKDCIKKKAEEGYLVAL
jgi:hypothetical protein